MNLESFTGPGSTPSRRRFWDKVTQAVLDSQKRAGDNVSVDEHQGAGTVINVDRKAGAGATDGACCGVTSEDFGETCIDDCASLSGFCVGTICYYLNQPGDCTILSESDCNTLLGTFRGLGTVCDPNPCIGACCIDGTCFSGISEFDCENGGGAYQGDESTCDPDPCTGGSGACCITTDLGGSTGAYCDCFGCTSTTNKSVTCSIETAADCASAGGSYKGNGSTCPYHGCFTGTFCEGESCDDCCPQGRCCSYDQDGHFRVCASTTESQCDADCCSPNGLCNGWTFNWTTPFSGCSGGDACPSMPSAFSDPFFANN